MDDLPSDYDAIVVGTGMTESVIAAAISRIGKSVLHLDANDYYGENWASFNLEGLENWVKTIKKNDTVDKIPNENLNGLINENENVINICPHLNVWNAECSSRKKKTVDACDEAGDQKSELEIINQEINAENKTELKDEPLEQIEKLSRRFNLDLCPKLLFSKGLLVQLLISSNIARYAEFKSVSQVLTWKEDCLEPVPCSRADVFSTKNVSVVQKRILVKILTLFSNFNENLDEFQGFENKTFLDYLKHKKLPDNLIHYILYAIAMGDNSTSCLDGVKACKAFLESLGRYGNTPFIFPMYGSGELPQCFCRLCAVFGGVYCLQRGIEGLIIKDKKCVGVISNNKRLNAENVILPFNYAPKNYLHDEEMESISRGVFITDRSISKGDKEVLTLLQFPPTPGALEKSVTVIELGSGTCTCPENFFVVHMTTKMKKGASLDLKHVVESLFENKEKEDCDEKNSKPRVLWSGTWNMCKGTSRTSDLCAENVKVCCSVDSELDYNFCITEAQRIFKELYPGEEFLPRAPDPEEIVLDTENSPSGEENLEKTENLPSGKEILEKTENSPSGKEILEKTENLPSEEEILEKTENSPSGEEILEKTEEVVGEEKIEKPIKAAGSMVHKSEDTQQNNENNHSSDL